MIAAVNDPVGLGLIKSLDRPGTNVTGTTNYAPHLVGERVRLLKTIYPAAAKVAMFANGNNANVPAQFALFSTEARAVGMQAAQLDVRSLLALVVVAGLLHFPSTEAGAWLHGQR